MKKEDEKQPKPNLEAFWSEISQRAEEIYKKRIADGKSGDQLSDWYQAEKETKKKYGL